MSQQSNLSGLPAQFVTAMRTLFDIMDDKNTGYVQFSDIENRWRDDGTKGLPKGVIESLKKVTPPNGLLSFNHFCAGLKICLLQNQVENARSSTSAKGNDGPLDHESNETCKINKHQIPKSTPSDIDHAQTVIGSKMPSSRLNAMGAQQRTLSMPQLQQQMFQEEDNGRIGAELRNYASDARLAASAKISQANPNRLALGPPKPPRLAVGLDRGVVGSSEVRGPVQSSSERNLDRAEIRTALQKWQIGLMMNGQDSSKNSSESGSRQGYPVDQGGRGSGDGKPSVDQTAAVPHKKTSGRRREPRRHTLQNGIDYNMLKRMKQIEQEKDVLMQGLQAVERAREWYLRHINAVQEKMKYLGKMGSHMEQWTEAQQERIELRRARVLEVNRHLALLCRWGSGEGGDSPLEDWSHMNLALPHHRRQQPTSQNPSSNLLVERLKHQNHLLTEEVSKKSERIAGLEREKSLLIRELFQLKSDLAGRRSGVGEEPLMLEEAAGGFM